MCTAHARAQGGADDNAADWYRKAFERYEAFRETGDDQILADFAADPRASITPEIRAALERARPIIELASRGSRLDGADFGIDLSEGPYTLLPHLSPMRACLRLMTADARVRLDAGDARGAAAAFAAGLRMAEHVTADTPVAITTLVGVAMFRLNNNAIQRALGEGTLDMEGARSMLEAAQYIADDDPFGFVESIEGERQGFAQWMLDNFTGEDGQKRFVQEVGPIMDLDVDNQAFLEMSQPEFEASLHSYDLALRKAVEAARNEDLEVARDEMARLEADAVAGVYGPITMMMMPSLLRITDTLIETYAQLDALLDDLEHAASSPEAALELRNAALWYLRAIELHESIAPVQWEELATFATNPSIPAPESIVGSARAGEDIVAILLEAATIERCNFDLQDTWNARGLLADLSHLEGMERNAQLMSASAMASASEIARETAPAFDGDTPAEAEVAARLAATFAMSRHVGMDARVKSTLTSIDIALIGADALDRALEEKSVSSVSGRTLVRKAIDGALHAGGFGVNAALTKHRSVTSTRVIRNHLNVGSDPGQFVVQFIDFAKQTGGDIAPAVASLPASALVATVKDADRLVGSACESFRTAPFARAMADYERWLAPFVETRTTAVVEWFMQGVVEAVEHALVVRERLTALRELVR